MKTKTLIISLILLLSLAAPGWGATYYVSFLHGNDSWNGTAPAFVSGTTGPKKTLGGGTGLLAAGDTLSLECGNTWNEGFNIISGSDDAHRTTYNSYVGAEGSAKPIITDQTAITNTGWTDDGGGKYSKDIGTSVCTWFYEDAIPLPKASDATLAEAYPCWYFNSGTHVAYYKPTSGDPSTHTLTRTVSGGRIGTAGTPRDYITIDGLRLYNCAAFYLATSNSPGGGGFSYLTFQNLDLINCCNGIGITQRNNNSVQYITIQNNTFDYCHSGTYIAIGTVTAPAHNSYITYSGNIVTNPGLTPSGNPIYALATSTDRDGCDFQNISDTLIEHNEISGAKYGAGISVWNDTASTTDFNNNIIRKNYVHDLAGGTVGNGIVYDAGTSNNSVHQCDIYYNIIANFGASAAGIKANHTQDSTNHSKIANNVIYNGGIGIYLFSGADYYEIKNNIVHTCTTLARSDVALGNNVWSYNCYKDGNSGTPFYANGSARNWAYWTGTLGADATGSITSDPLFANTGGSYALATDFKLQAGSPCINAGTDVGLTEDYGGFPLKGLPDIGAWELQVVPNAVLLGAPF